MIPTRWPKDRFDEAWDLQGTLQELYCRIVGEEGRLFAVLKDCIGKVDEQEWRDGIVTGLWRVHEAVRKDADGLGYI